MHRLRDPVYPIIQPPTGILQELVTPWTVPTPYGTMASDEARPRIAPSFELQELRTLLPTRAAALAMPPVGTMGLISADGLTRWPRALDGPDLAIRLICASS